ncbi:hypothetical protein DXU04_27320 [Bradyrhizobium diazoefficiens]|nr:hypothetical protein BD122_33760 [Bradyrhizobium diazoefficiens]KOY04866.1 hypothetical protein AF336_39665 [Bradyrhizobium diazoefficiens]
MANELLETNAFAGVYSTTSIERILSDRSIGEDSHGRLQPTLRLLHHMLHRCNGDACPRGLQPSKIMV